MLQPFISPLYSPDLSPTDYFLFPKFNMKLKGLHFADVAEIQEVVTDELKKVQKEEFSAAFQKLYNRAKACIYANGAYFELKKRLCLPHVSSIFKKFSPKSFGSHCVCKSRFKYVQGNFLATYLPMGKYTCHSQIWKMEIFLLLHHFSECLYVHIHTL